MIEQLDNTDIYSIAKLGLKQKTAKHWALTFHSYMVTRLAWRPAESRAYQDYHIS